MRFLSEMLGRDRRRGPRWPASPSKRPLRRRCSRRAVGPSAAALALLRLDRPAPRKLEIALTFVVLLGAGFLGAERGGQFDAVSARHGGVGDWAARALGLGVEVVTVSGATHMSEPRLLAIAGIDLRKSLPVLRRR